jgi:cell division protein FtsI/penicillin-binding protein 2
MRTPADRQPWRFGLSALAFLVIAGVVVWRLWSLQILEGARFTELSRKQSSTSWTLPSQRGAIYDTYGAPLVESQHAWRVIADAKYLEDRLRATIELSRILGLSREEIRKELETGRNGRVLAQGIDDNVAQAIRDLRIQGLDVRRDYVRVYREGNLAGHVLGFLADGKGGAGIEMRFNELLAGKPGHQDLKRDARGRVLIDTSEFTPAVPGARVQLTIDVVIQRRLEEELQKAWIKHAPLRAAGIVVRPSTGEIVAMASLPSFDPVTRVGLSGEALRNNAMGLVYEPGSTFKPLIAGAAVVEKLTTFTESIYCERGRWTYREGRAARTITDHSLKHGGHGNLTVIQGIAVSDNILMAKLGIRLGPQRLGMWVDRLGFGRRTGLCLPGEESGIVTNKKNWKNINEGMSIPMGHNIAVTPLQLVMAHAAVANGGLWNPPKLVKRIWTQDLDGRDTDLSLPALPATQRMYEVEHAAAIEEAMTHVLTEGTGKGVQLDGYTAAGKTGTTEKLVNGVYSKQLHVGSFVCWAPADGKVGGTKPELVALVVIDEPTKNGRYGSETAAPVVQAVLQDGLEHLKVEKDPALIKEPKDGAKEGLKNAVADRAPVPSNRGGRR